MRTGEFQFDEDDPIKVKPPTRALAALAVFLSMQSFAEFAGEWSDWKKYQSLYDSNNNKIVSLEFQTKPQQGEHEFEGTWVRYRVVNHGSEVLMQVFIMNPFHSRAAKFGDVDCGPPRRLAGDRVHEIDMGTIYPNGGTRQSGICPLNEPMCWDATRMDGDLKFRMGSVGEAKDWRSFGAVHYD